MSKTIKQKNKQGIPILSAEDDLFEKTADKALLDKNFEQLLEKSFSSNTPAPSSEKEQNTEIPSPDNDFFDDCTEKDEPDKSFADLLDESLAGKSGQTFIKEKIRATQKPSLSISSKIVNYPEPQEDLDLHGLKGDEAELKTDFFIRDARARGLVTVRIIVGKGTHSKGPAVLPNIIEAKIIDLKREGRIRTFKWEKRRKLKSGSIIVYLK